MRAQVSRKNVVVFTGAGISAESGLQLAPKRTDGMSRLFAARPRTER
jgi:NAD-dependent SIR2 family protein deacetylase